MNEIKAEIIKLIDTIEAAQAIGVQAKGKDKSKKPEEKPEEKPEDSHSIQCQRVIIKHLKQAILWCDESVKR